MLALHPSPQLSPPFKVLRCAVLCCAAGGGALALSAVFAGFVLYGMQRVKRLDKFEKEIKG